MHTTEPVQRIRIYISERDTAEGQALYLTVLGYLRQHGATGATVLRGVAGFGAGIRRRTAGVSDFTQSLPVVIEWVDRTERVARIMPTIDELLPDALITVEELQVYRAALRSSGPFGERQVGEVAAQDVLVTHPDASLLSTALQIAQHQQLLIPVLDAQQRIAGIITAADIERRSMVPLRLLHPMSESDQIAMLSALPTQSVADVMTVDVRAVSTVTLIPQAVATLVEWGLNELPVVDMEGHFAGLFGVEQALQAVLATRHTADSPIRDADPPPPVSLLMQRTVPTCEATEAACDVLDRIRTVRPHLFIIVDNQKPIGVFNDEMLIAHLEHEARQAWVDALQQPESPLPETLTSIFDQQATVDLSYKAITTIDLQTTRDDAIRQLLDQQTEQLVVVDEEERLVGLLGRYALLRSLAQESSG
ncbi:MAG: CBS domain [Chloroflexi bacterium AL-W]|nr:CBS domain [Chloroflexi bacterium AL-N1]NOK66227.1 CBS domain [Chloroflexi bacterium AL-N10]NOK73108.1 CBS domain [Chloroflexi bacterium AL-N5]NOK80005.1 CBS domain [Chloroflexi bacterium AL-W]NOK88139.1 CBS domain [Chloroflexi bacterium AL-N15]